MKFKILNKEKGTYQKLSSQKEGEQVALDKVSKTMMTEEEKALEQFKEKVKSKTSPSEDVKFDPAVYRAFKSKRKSSATIYVELTKENAEKLQEKALNAQEKILKEVTSQQQKFEAAATKFVVAKEHEMIEKSTNMLLAGLTKILNKPTVADNEDQENKVPESAPAPENIERENSMGDLDDFDGVDSSLMNMYFK